MGEELTDRQFSDLLIRYQNKPEYLATSIVQMVEKLAEQALEAKVLREHNERQVEIILELESALVIYAREENWCREFIDATASNEDLAVSFHKTSFNWTDLNGFDLAKTTLAKSGIILESLDK